MLISYQVSLILLDQVHLVHQAEDLCVRRVLQDGFQTRLVVMHIFLQLSALHIKHIDQHLYIAKDVVSLTREVVFHESVLAVQFTCKDEARMKSSSQKPSNKTRLYRGARDTYPPQSHRFSTRLPRNRTWECSTSTEMRKIHLILIFHWSMAVFQSKIVMPFTR